MPETTLRFGLPFLLETPSVLEAARLCHALGLAFVELNTNFPPSQFAELDANALRDLTQTFGCFFTLHLDDSLDPFNPNPLVRKAYVDTVVEGINLAKAAEIPVINLHFPRGNIVTLPDGKHYIYQEYPEAFRSAVVSFRTACEAAVGSAPIKLCIENTNGWEAYEQQAIDLLLSCECFGLTLDIGHDDAAGNVDFPFFLSRKPRLHHMHAHDGQGDANHKALGIGRIPLQERLNLAQECGATVVLETKTKAALEQSVQYLRERGRL